MMRMHTAVSATLSAILNDQHAWRRHLDGSAPLREIGNSKLRQIIEELGEAMSSLRAERRRTETVLQQTANGIIAIDSTGKIDLFNRAASLILGQEESEVIGKRLADLDLHPEIRRLVSNCIAGGTVCEAEVKLPGVPWKVVRMRAAPLKASDGRQDSAVLILQDMTEVRRHENHQKEFVSNVSHELRTPITAVRSTAEALMGGAKNDPAVVDKFLNTIVLESERLSALIEDLMDIAKRDSGILQTRMETVSVEKVIGRVVNITSPAARQKNIDVRVGVEQGLVALCDEMQVEQMIRNLVDNAIKYTPEGGKVEISAKLAGDAVIFEIKDNGIGIPQGEVGRIFERFYRVDKARSRRLGGTGLGLSIVKDIVDSHGGEIQVETQLGKGSTFTVKIPAHMS